MNLSTHSLLDDSFATEVTLALGRTGVPPSRLVLEITETTLMADPERARRVLTTLADRGVRFAIDDFGTGYSSLASLKDLPVHDLKIDKSFVAGRPGSCSGGCRPATPARSSSAEWQAHGSA